MGWEQTCGRRPDSEGAARPRTRARSRSRRAGEQTALERARLLDAKRRAELEQRDLDAVRNWSWVKHLKVAAMCLTGLWVICYVVSAIMVEALLRMTD